MSTLQHERITTLAQELRLQALPDLYGAVAQSAAKRKDASYADFLEEVLKGERDARRVRAREMLPGLPASRHSRRSRPTTLPLQAAHHVSKSRNSLGWASSSAVKTSSCSARAAWAKRTWRSPSGCSPRIEPGRCASSLRPIW